MSFLFSPPGSEEGDGDVENLSEGGPVRQRELPDHVVDAVFTSFGEGELSRSATGDKHTAVEELVDDDGLRVVFNGLS